MGAGSEWGPLAALAGTWEGTDGIDVAFSHSQGKVLDTPYRESATFKPFGPVDNGRQHLHGLDYRTAMWRGSEEDPFHTEVGYWLWDAETGEVLRGFVVPRGITILAGGTAMADATTFTMRAKPGDPLYPIGQNQYLDKNARTTSYEVTMTVNADGTVSYEEHTMLEMPEIPGSFDHSDRNTLRRTGD
ncbi:MAG: heme-binding beta-barrel domain-containing protein [Acidimicrobiia bacterium]